MKPELSNDVWIYDNEREVSPNNGSGELSSTRRKHFTDLEQRSTSIDVIKQEQPQRAPITENEDSITMHPVHEFDQDSMLQFKTDDIISRKQKQPSNIFTPTNIDHTKKNMQWPKTKKPPSYKEKEYISYDPSIAFFGDSMSNNKTSCSRSSLDQNSLHRGYVSTLPSARCKSKDFLVRSNNQKLSVSDQKNENQKDFDRSISSGGFGHNESFSHSVAGNNLPQKSRVFSQENIVLSTDNEYRFKSHDQTKLNFEKKPNIREEIPQNNAVTTPVHGLFDFFADEKETDAPVQIHNSSGNNATSSKKIQEKSTNEDFSTGKNRQLLNTTNSQPASHNVKTNYVIVKVNPDKITHKPYDVPTLSQSLLNRAIQTPPSHMETTIPEFPNHQCPTSKSQLKKSQTIQGPHDIPTPGQSIMNEAIDGSSQKNESRYCIFDVPTKAQFILKEASANPSIQDRIVSSCNAITTSILSIPIGAPPSPEDSEDELPFESRTSYKERIVKKPLPLTYAIDASNKAFHYINNGYPQSPKHEEIVENSRCDNLYKKTPPVKIKLESIEGNTIDNQYPQNQALYLSSKMPGSFDFLDVPIVQPEPTLYDFLPYNHISEREEPAIHGQTACYTTVDIIKPEKQFSYYSTPSSKSGIEPSIFGQAPSFYPASTTDTCLSKHPKKQVSETTDNDNKVQGDSHKKRYKVATMYHGNQEKNYRPLQQYEKTKPTNENASIAEMSMAIPVPDRIDVDDFSFEIRKPEDKDREAQELAYNEVLVPAEFDEEQAKEINPEQVETVKVKNSFFKKIALTPQQALRFYNNHSTLIDLAIATNPVGAAFVIAKDVNKQRLTNKKARAELAAEKAAHPERFLEEEKPNLTFKERLMNAPKSSVKMLKENQGYIDAVLAATPGGRVLDAARFANKYAKKGVQGYTHASAIHNDGIKKASQKLAFDNLKSYGGSYVPGFSIPGTSSGNDVNNTNSFIPESTTTRMANDMGTSSYASATESNNFEPLIHSSVNHDTNVFGTNQIRMSKRFNFIPDEGPISIDTSELRYRNTSIIKKGTELPKSNIDDYEFRNYKETFQNSTDRITMKNTDIPRTFNSPATGKNSPITTSLNEPNTRKNSRNVRIITDPATMKSYTLYNQPNFRKYSDINQKKTITSDEPSNTTYQFGNNTSTTSKDKKPKLNTRLFFTPVDKEVPLKKDGDFKDESTNKKTQLREIPMRNGSVYVPIEAFDNTSFSTYISGHLENRRGSLQKTVGRIVRNDKMKDNGDKKKLAGKTKIKVYQYKRKSF